MLNKMHPQYKINESCCCSISIILWQLKKKTAEKYILEIQKSMQRDTHTKTETQRNVTFTL